MREGEWGSVRNQRVIFVCPCTTGLGLCEIWCQIRRLLHGRVQAETRQMNFLIVIIISLSYECTNMFSRPDCEAVSTLCGKHLVWGLGLPPIKAFQELYVTGCLPLACLSPWAWDGTGKDGLSPSPPGMITAFPKITLGQGRLKGGLQPDCTMHSPLITTDIFNVLRADIATSPTSFSLTQLPHQFRENRPRLSLIFFWSPISSMRVAGR